MKRTILLMTAATIIFSCTNEGIKIRVVDNKKDSVVKDSSIGLGTWSSGTLRDVGSNNDYMMDTTIRQYVYYENGRYRLRTSIQLVLDNTYRSWVLDGRSYKPDYSREISGSFKYIKSRKRSEYRKARWYINNNKALSDSVEILRNIKSN